MIQTTATPLLTFNSLVLICACTGIIYYVATAIYNIYFHPLAKFPGPKLRAASVIPAWITMWTGAVLPFKELHEKYGTVVRTAPDSLSFNSPGGWKEIYGHVQGRSQIPKDPAYYSRGKVKGSGPSIMNAEDADHSRFRRNLSHAFSTAALAEQESIITSWFDLLIEKLHLDSTAKGVVDMVSFFNWVAFDITGDMVFGEPFHALEDGKNHFFMDNIFRFMRSGRLLQTGTTFPLAGIFIKWMMNNMPAIVKGRMQHRAFVVNQIDHRLSKETDRKDFMSYMLKARNDKGMSQTELYDTGNVLIVAGSETTATALSGAIWLLLKTPSTLTKLNAEVRSAFAHASDINFINTNSLHLPYLTAVIEEAMRWYPPIPGLQPRRTTFETVIDGHVVPKNTLLGVHPYSANHSAKNFKDPEVFDPERWMPGKESPENVKEARQPFSIGPRNCLGRTLAYAEMTGILARIIYSFDLELCNDSLNWAHGQKAWVLWDKPALHVKVTPRGVGKMQ